MNIFKRISKFAWIGLISILLPSKAKSSALSEVDKRIEVVRKSIKNELANKEAKDISIPFKNYTTSNEWVNWGNWGNWNNWNNWAKWNNWANWNNWNNWINY